MAGNTQIDPRTEGGLFSFMHGLVGYFVTLGIFLTIVVVLTTLAITTQDANAINYYKINQNLDGLKFNSPDNYKQRMNVKE